MQNTKGEGFKRGQWQYEFPEWTDMPDVPEGFVDQSWHNDVMPNYADESRKLRIWIEHPDESMREMPGVWKRFTLVRGEYGHPDQKTVFETDDWSEMLQAIKKA
jgi:hypothetical protein